LEFADHVYLLIERNHVRRELQKLKAEARKTGLKINVKKTKILRNRNEQIGQIKIWNVDIEEVRRVNYLGVVIEKNGRSKADATKTKTKRQRRNCKPS
jgi:hypothetical protein